jgi:FKBP-type peptidyl-prolyl cis-trans isomerase FklB
LKTFTKGLSALQFLFIKASLFEQQYEAYMESNKEKISYCIGLETGKNLRRQFEEIDQQYLLEGFTDALSGIASKLPQDEVNKFLQLLRQETEGQQKEFLKRLAQENKKSGEEFLDQNRSKDDVRSLPSGLQYKILSTGAGPQPTFLDTVSVHYKATFIDGTEFDSSYKRGKPQVTPLNRVIAGWAEAIQKMHVGDKWQLFIPSYLAYGEVGMGNAIPPNATLIFELELLGIEG